MTGHKPFSELTKDFSPERKAKIASLTNQLREEMTLQELREALNLHQTELSDRLGIKQAAVSPMENRKDIHVSQAAHSFFFINKSRSCLALRGSLLALYPQLRITNYELVIIRSLYALTMMYWSGLSLLDKVTKPKSTPYCEPIWKLTDSWMLGQKAA